MNDNPVMLRRVHVLALRGMDQAAVSCQISSTAIGSLTPQERSRLSHLPPRVLASIERALSHLAATTSSLPTPRREAASIRGNAAAGEPPAKRRVDHAVATSKRV